MPNAPTPQGSVVPAPGFLSIGDAHQELLGRGAEDDEANQSQHGSEHQDTIQPAQVDHQAADGGEGEDTIELDPLDVEIEDLEAPGDSFDDDDDNQPQLYTVKVNGEEKQVTIEELQKGFQLETDYRNKTAGISEKEKELAATQDEANRNREKYAGQLDVAIKSNESILAADKDIDWEALYEENPFEYMKKKEEIRDAKDKISANKMELAKIDAEKAVEAQGQFGIYRDAQKSLIMGDEKNPKNPGIIPSWRDSKVAQAESKEMEQYMLARGLKPAEIEQIWDARVVGMIHDAFMYSKGKKVADKKVKKAPRMNKSSKGRPAPATTTRRIKTLEKELDTTGDPRAAAQLLLARESHDARKTRRG